MQVVGQLTEERFSKQLATGDLALRVGPYVYSLQSNLPPVTAGIRTLYRDFPLAAPGDFVDYKLAIRQAGLLQRLRSQAELLFDEVRQFEPIPTGQAYAFLEWGMNWCVSLHANEYLKLHAATVSKNNATIVMPGVPGSGKSTLCAALGLDGWRILSDEHAMVIPGTADVVPLCRPVSLKNESIEVIRSFSPNAVFGPTSKETHKGRVAHMKADLYPGSHDSSPLPAEWMVFPRFSREESQQLAPRRRTDSFILAAYHSFNYSLLCEAGFDAMERLIRSVACYDLVYHDLEWAVDAIGSLPEGRVLG